jgi:hypothetical protein
MQVQGGNSVKFAKRTQLVVDSYVLHIDRNPFTSYSFQFLDCVSKCMVDRYDRLIYSTQFHLIFIVCIKGGCCIPFHHIVFVRPQSEQSTDCLLLASQKILSSSLTSRV